MPEIGPQEIEFRALDIELFPTAHGLAPYTLGEVSGTLGKNVPEVPPTCTPNREPHTQGIRQERGKRDQTPSYRTIYVQMTENSAQHSA